MTTFCTESYNVNKNLFFFAFQGFDCSKVSCIKDCPLNSQDESVSEQQFHEPHAKEFYNSQSKTDMNTPDTCCNLKCRKSCVTSLNEIVSHGESWMNSEDPCTNHVCMNGIISNHTSVCSGLPCSSEYHVYRNDKCCPSCDPSWASFCPEDEYCDIACQYGFKKDSQRGCDLCRCARKISEATTSSSTTPTDDDTQTSRTVKFYLYFDPTDGATKNLLIGITITFVIFVICLAAIGFYFHRKVYRKIPLLSLGNSSA